MPIAPIRSPNIIDSDSDSLLTVHAAALILCICGAAQESKEYTSVKHLNLTICITTESGLLNFSITLAHFLVWFGREEYPVAMIGILMSSN
jgi:hypothetical protein